MRELVHSIGEVILSTVNILCSLQSKGHSGECSQVVSSVHLRCQVSCENDQAGRKIHRVPYLL